MALSSSNVTSGFIDLATYDELEKYMYGGDDATAYFVRETRKATWFTQVPVCLNKSSGDSQFGQNWSASISRSGDYLLNTWLQVELPFLKSTVANQRLRWVQNFMHNIIEECWITFNDLVAVKFDNVHLDFWSNFAYSNTQKSVYNTMIGNADYNNVSVNQQSSSNSFPCNVGVGENEILPGGVSSTGSTPDEILYLKKPLLHLPLPFFFSRDSGVALPTAALPYNDMRINFKFRNWNKLLLVDEVPTSNPEGDVKTRHATKADFSVCESNGISASFSTKEPVLTNVQVWANYAIVSNDERKRMACAPRDMLIEQSQVGSSASGYEILNGSDFNPSFNLHFSHSVKALFFGLRNVTPHPVQSVSPVDLSYYSTLCPGVSNKTGTVMPYYGKVSGQYNPVANASLIYENTNRLHQLNSGYYSLVQPFYHATGSDSNNPGMHMYSYSLDMLSLDPLGSTNYGKITNVSLVLQLSNLATKALSADTSNVNVGFGSNGALTIPQKYEFVCTAVNNNIVRISGGALGFPVL